MAWMLGKDGKMVFVEPGTPVYGEIPAPLAMNIVNPQDGQALVYDGAKGEWVNGGSFDPTITNPQDGQVLVYDGTAGKWVNGAGGGGGGGSLIITPTLNAENMTMTSDKTAQEIYDAYISGKVVVAFLDDGAGNGTGMTLVSMGTGSGGYISFYFHMAQGTPPTDMVLDFYATSMSAYPVCSLG